MKIHRQYLFYAVNALATVQFVWCYLWLTRPYVNTALYSQGKERMPFQGRLLMMPAMRWAHSSYALQSFSRLFALSHFWFPRTVQPEVLVQAAIDVFCVAAAGWFTVKMYEASSRRNLLTPFVYPLLLAACTATYVMHTVQNFRFIYDLPSLALFTAALYVIYFRRHWIWFAAIFLVGTINRETTLLLLPIYGISEAFNGFRLDWRRALRLRPVLLISGLAIAWVSWEMLVRSIFRANQSEFYPRANWNIKSMLLPLAWPQLFSACGYLLLAVVMMRRRIPDARLRTWLWIIPIWVAFMFSYGILIETRVFGELIGLVVCSTALIAEETIVLRMWRQKAMAPLAVMERSDDRAMGIEAEREAV